MCLASITKRYKGASKKVHFAYKVFDLVNGRYHQEYQAIGKIWNTPVGKWIKAESVPLITNSPLFEEYPSGFHAFLTRKAADKWRAGDNDQTIVRVKVRGIRTLGRSLWDLDTIVADEMYVPRLNKNA